MESDVKTESPEASTQEWSAHGAHPDAVGAAPEALAEALRLRMPNTEIVAGNYPVRGVWVTIGKGSHCAEFCVSVKDIGAHRDLDDAVETALAMVRARLDEWTKPPRGALHGGYSESRIRAWAGLPDMPPFVRERARKLLDEDRAHLRRSREQFAEAEAMVSNLEAALAPFDAE